MDTEGSSIRERDDFSNFPIVIIGGGISGVSCLQHLALNAPDEEVVLISASSLVTTTTNIKVLTKTLVQFDVEERKIDWLTTVHPKVKVIHDKVTSFDPEASSVKLKSGSSIYYSRLCICTGASPKGLPGVPGADKNPNVIGVRDAATAIELRRRVENARCVLIAGNGGIASEVAYGLSGVKIVWAIRDNHINAAFIDPGAATYLEGSLKKRKEQEVPKQTEDGIPEISGVAEKAPNVNQPSWKIFRTNMNDGGIKCEGEAFGSALGPDWHNDFPLHGIESKSSLHIEYNCEISQVLTPEEVMAMEGLSPLELFENAQEGSSIGVAEGKEVHPDLKATAKWPVYVILTNGKCIGCDVVVAATGVIPNSYPFVDVHGGPKVCPSDGNGLMVDLRMRTSTDRVFAAGDVCTAAWPNRSKHWLQMRLWTQARMMGLHAGRCILASLDRAKKYKSLTNPTDQQVDSVPAFTTADRNEQESENGSEDKFKSGTSDIPLSVINVHWKEDEYNVQMDDDESMYDFCFELFSHVTTFFGCRTILLGLFNGQGLGKEYEAIVRVSEGEYIKAIIGRDGQLAGAVLVGETDLEETFENLILSGLDISAMNEDLLHPCVDIEDYFD